MTTPHKAADELAEAFRAWDKDPTDNGYVRMLNALTRYDAARAVSTTPLPEPWSWCKERPENVECGGCGFEMWGGHVDTFPIDTANNACPVCAEADAALDAWKATRQALAAKAKEVRGG